MAAAVFFLDPLLAFYPTRFYHRDIMALGAKTDSNSSPRNDGSGFPSTQERKTPPPKESVAEQIRSSVQSTPLSNHAPTVNPTANPDHLVADFDRYILDDLRDRVFMSADHYFSNILHLPADWRTNDEITSKIEAVKNDAVFKNHVKAYVALCNESSPGEKNFYHPHSLMCNSAFDVLGATEDSGIGIYRQDAKPVDGGLEKNIPDTLGVLRAMFNSSGNVVDNMKDKGPEYNFSGFTDFQPWINCIRQQFLQGFDGKNHHKVYKDRGPTGSFDDETLQACVSYSAIVEICNEFAGSALIVHNDQLKEGA
ncbi:uncharacterized protein BT62DRAFT_993462 [Guyanagaster necrorhizus]|uniref:Uncharacterized protein n=1 Tax=Guyanagaster necrorhizus TaxID=856835 RepID=A0A9P7VV15_9AGAR|nr:uncharacterized protein BT62DRAFT_993462 [Guyanagaster necrorhizus MCA 3950]KAG7447128.1 hypothetical protein BT62DRAFT_993462 [Guyanagaster necrorhizus MCA 3950]